MSKESLNFKAKKELIMTISITETLQKNNQIMPSAKCNMRHNEYKNVK
jgi:hypothetical protein